MSHPIAKVVIGLSVGLGLIAGAVYLLRRASARPIPCESYSYPTVYPDVSSASWLQDEIAYIDSVLGKK